MNQVLHRGKVFLLGDLDRVGRNNFCLKQRRSIRKIAGNGVLDGQLLELKIGARGKQILLILGHRALGAHNFNGRQRPDLDLFLVI